MPLVGTLNSSHDELLTGISPLALCQKRGFSERQVAKNVVGLAFVVLTPNFDLLLCVA